MLSLPIEIISLLSCFAPLFTQPTFVHAQTLFIGAILCRGARRVTSILRVMGLEQEKRFERYHRFLNRAAWNSLSAGRILLGALIKLLPDSWPIVIVVDDTIERRKGKRIKAKGCYRDACRSSKKAVVKCFGLKWVCLTLMVPLPWNRRPWALPFMTLLAPSKSGNEARGKKHRTTIDWTITAMRIVNRWLKRSWILIGDGGFSCVRLAHACQQNGVTFISRLRLDTCLYQFPTKTIKKRRGRKREKGARAPSLKHLAHSAKQPWETKEVSWYGSTKKRVSVLSGKHLWYRAGEKPLPIQWVLVKDPEGKYKPEAFFTTDLSMPIEKIIEWFVLRWNVEVTFEEVRAHLGVETQRQWSDKAIARCTPLLMGLYSLITIIGYQLQKSKPLPVISSAWYKKENEGTFSDVLTFVRRAILNKKYFNKSEKRDNFVKITQNELETLINQLAMAA